MSSKAYVVLHKLIHIKSLQHRPREKKSHLRNYSSLGSGDMNVNVLSTINLLIKMTKRLLKQSLTKSPGISLRMFHLKILISKRICLLQITFSQISKEMMNIMKLVSLKQKRHLSMKLVQILLRFVRELYKNLNFIMKRTHLKR